LCPYSDRDNEHAVQYQTPGVTMSVTHETIIAHLNQVPDTLYLRMQAA
jgi:hypothetical protein